jgi:membrane protein implicated in regulation of membrane protease activity
MLRIPSILFGLLTVLGVYFLTKELKMQFWIIIGFILLSLELISFSFFLVLPSMSLYTRPALVHLPGQSRPRQSLALFFSRILLVHFPFPVGSCRSC